MAFKKTNPNSMNDVSIDCEALGVLYDAPVIAIGAVAFDRNTGKLGQEFYKEVNLPSACAAGRVEGKTIAWWMTQTSNEARQVFAERDAADQTRWDLATALDAMCSWFRALPGLPNVWANGPAQDITWIQHALRNGTVGLAEPWHYKKVRDFRTIYDLAESLTGYTNSMVPAVGTAHNALDDAKWQAKAISFMFQRLRDRAVEDEEV